jgi:hypothetical protein
MNASKPENVCAICKKVFSRKADCNRHVRLHSGIRPYLCEAAGCGKRFAQFTALKTHRNVHTGLKPFKCDFVECNAAFGDPSSCARHRREIHRPRKPFKCPVPGCPSSIRRSSSFKTHLKKHGLDPSTYLRFSTPDHSPVEVWQSIQPEGMMEGQVATPNGSSCNGEISLPVPELGLSELWDSFSLPGDPSLPLILQPELSSVVSSSSPMLLAPTPRMAPESEQFFTPRASPASSSGYSSPMTTTPALTPELGPGFLTDIGVQLNSYLPIAHDWARNPWLDHGIQFVG